MVKIRKLGHVGIFVKDVERSKKFYTEILGFKVSDVNEQGITFFFVAPRITMTPCLSPCPRKATTRSLRTEKRSNRFLTKSIVRRI
jgi:catechol 2,3-dioxygenase-like lactoylglutathione lyase family enzyme